MEDLQKIAEAVLEDLNKELAQNEENGKMLQGAMQGVRLLFQKVAESKEEKEVGSGDEQHSESGGKAKTKK